jgi:coenzyme PQQ precursor peptide PqqA
LLEAFSPVGQLRSRVSPEGGPKDDNDPGGIRMKRVWTRPVLTEKPAGMEVTAYLSAK